MNGQPDTLYGWIFHDTRTGDIWGGATVQDTGWASLGQTWYSPYGQEFGYYEIIEARDLGTDTQDQEGTTYVIGYHDAQTNTNFEPYYGSQMQPATIYGPGTELDYILVGSEYLPFGQGGNYLV